LSRSKVSYKGKDSKLLLEKIKRINYNKGNNNN